LAKVVVHLMGIFLDDPVQILHRQTGGIWNLTAVLESVMEHRPLAREPKRIPSHVTEPLGHVQARLTGIFVLEKPLINPVDSARGRLDIRPDQRKS
jgi:hypothetical protein